jgi:hypothetical protein
VSESSGTWKQAMILNLDNFAGSVKIQSSQFTNNNYLYDKCDLYDGKGPEWNHESLPIDNKTRSLDLKDNWNYLKRESDWKFDKIQLKSLISI